MRWILVLVLKVIFSRLKINYSFWRKIGIFRHGKMADSKYAMKIYEQHMSRMTDASSYDGKVVLEIGPGDSVASGVFTYLRGGRSILLDVGDYAQKDIKIYERLISEGAVRGASSLIVFRSFPEMLSSLNIKYLTDGLASLRSLDSNSVDFLFSNAVLEHIKLKEFEQFLLEMHRILKPDGLCSHRIDFKDHLGGGLNNLRFSNHWWESPLFSESGFYTNRLRYTDMIVKMTNSGFDVKVINKSTFIKPVLPRKYLAKEFESCTDEALSISGVDVLLSKKN